MQTAVMIRKFVVLLLICLPVFSAYSQEDNGIHVGEAKAYDDRQLTIMLDGLSRSLQGNNFVDQKALAGALGNVQGFQNTDTSASFFANGAVGPQAAAVFAGSPPAGASAAPTASSDTAPTVTINVSPPATGSAPAASTSAAPALPTLQTPPAYNPNFGANSGDLLTDEVNLTYQIYNLGLLLNRSLTDRSFNHDSRLQAVVGFDVDLEPDQRAKNAVAVVEITACMLPATSTTAVTAAAAPATDARSIADCSTSEEKPHVVALMPEQGSHNAATLSQKANAFSGALAAQVFSAGASFQKRSQVFYLYRDIDTLSFQHPDSAHSNLLHFGWQFRPVLGQPTVSAGLRHMMVVLSLPAADATDGGVDHRLALHVETHWVGYDKKVRSTTTHSGWFTHLDSTPSSVDQSALAVPATSDYQTTLQPRISTVKWVPTDAANGVAVITGDNFFLGTTVRVGSKTYTGANDGLTLKSDKELEIALPVSAVASGGILSGRYGLSKDIVSEDPFLLANGFYIKNVEVAPQGSDLSVITFTLVFRPPAGDAGKAVECYSPGANIKPYPAFVLTHQPVLLTAGGVPADLSSVLQATIGNGSRSLNYPVVSVDGKQDSLQTTFDTVPHWECDRFAALGTLIGQLNATVPAKDVAGNSQEVAITFPFEGRRWSQSFAHYTPALKIDRLGSDSRARLLLTSTSPGDDLCDGDWFVQLDSCEVGLNVHGVRPGQCSAGSKKQSRKKAPKDLKERQPALKCIGGSTTALGLDISAGELKGYKQLLLVHHDGVDIDDRRVGAVPDAKPKPAEPSLTAGQKASVTQFSSRTVTLTGKHLDKVTSVLFDKTNLKVVTQEDEKIVIDIPLSITGKPGDDQILLISDGNDPVVADLRILPTSALTQRKK